MMKNVLFVLLLFAVLGLKAQDNESIIIPAPVKFIKNVGKLDVQKLGVNYYGFKSTPQNLLNFTKGIIAKEKGSVIVKEADSYQNALLLKLETQAQMHEEGYFLNVNTQGIEIKAKTERGLFYGLQSLIQLLLNDSKEIACVTVEDYPRYKYRGLHLDVGRHVFPVSFIKEYIDLLAHYKLNSFHWHLTEDQGWRIEIIKYPKLTSIGGYREQSIIGRLKTPPQIFDGNKYGGFYTQEEVKEVVAYAASKYVTVIPEIEMPGHSLAALSAYPELACGKNPGPFKASDKWGIFEDVYCGGKEETYQFLENVLIEVLALFPSEYIHIGGDESPKAKWKSCEYCQKKIKKEKLKDEHELQSYFIQRMEKFLNKRGRKIIGWDEILEGGLAPNATVMSWRGTEGGIAAAKQNHDVIMTPSTHLYLDYRESKSTEEPIAIGGYVSLEKVYNYNPTPEELSVEQQKHILGVQANLWTEYIPTQQKVWYKLIPRVFALSEIAWTSLENKNWVDFTQNRLPVHLAKVDDSDKAFHVPSAVGVMDTTIHVEKEYLLNLKNPVKGAKMYYTINSYVPYDFDFLYEKPVTIKVPKGEQRIVRVVVVTPSGRRSVVTKTVLKGQ